VNIETTFVWNVTPCSLLDANILGSLTPSVFRHFDPKLVGSSFLRKTAVHLQDHTGFHSRRWLFS